VSPCHRGVYQFAAKLATGASDDDLHDLALSGSHHQRLSRYHCTVD
jgi:hypothetical protein